MATIATFNYVQGDTGPQLKLTLTDEDTSTATDLTGATVKMHLELPVQLLFYTVRPYMLILLQRNP